MRRAPHEIFDTRSLWAFVLIVSIIFAYAKRQEIGIAMAHGYENVAYAIHPTAARAMTYGEKHFDAQDPFNYDIDRAEYFFDKAAFLDPTTPYLYHELARIDFLKGNFTSALAKIDLEIALHGEAEPHSYYVRGLIEGYMGDYPAAEGDYQTALTLIPITASDPKSWATVNDYAWVLLKDGKAQDAAVALEQGLAVFPGNPWLLNTYAIALFESGDLAKAKEVSPKALNAADMLTLQEWLGAYPGNDPSIAALGLTTFQTAAKNNMHSILSATSSHTLQ